MSKLFDKVKQTNIKMAILNKLKFNTYKHILANSEINTLAYCILYHCFRTSILIIANLNIYSI